MATITTRSGKGSPLTNNEVDANFTNLNTDKAELSGAAFTGAITTNSTIDGRDVATDGTKLDGIEASADVTDTANVTSAGALMDSELTSIASVKALNQGVATTDSPTFVDVTATSLDISGNIDVDGTTNLDATNIVGALDVTGTSQINGYLETDNSHNYFKSNSTSNASLTLRKNASGADSIDFLQLRNNANGLIGKIEGDGNISFASATFTGAITGTSATFTRLDINATNTKLKGDLLANTDAAYDIGASGANRPRNLYLSNSISAADITTTGAGAFGSLDVTGTATFSPTGGTITLSANGHITSKQSLDVATAGGRFIGSSNRGILGQVRIEQTANSTDGGYIEFDTCASGSTSPTSRMKIDSSGNVGIGTGSPSASLELNVPTGDGLLINSADVGTIKMTLANGSQKNWGFATTNLAAGDFGLYQSNSNGGDPITAGTAKLYINSSGNVGIACQPSTRLTVGAGSGSEEIRVDAGAGWADLRLHSDATNGGSIYFNDGADAGQIFYYHPENSMRFHTNATERARLDSSGNLLVGKTITDLGTAGHTFGNDGYLYHTRSGDIMFLNRLNSHGTVITFLKDGATVGTISTNANSLPSDRNFKRNIKDLTLGLDFVESLNPVTYNFKIDDEGQAVMTGLIAQEVEESLTAAGVEKNSMTLLQHSPTEDVNESDYQMDYLKFVPILINSIKEQQTLIESLTARIAALEE